MRHPLLREKLKGFLEEDAAFGDVTTEAVVEPGDASAEVFTREDGVVAGVREGLILLDICGISVSEAITDGSRISAGQAILTMSGENRSILMVERTLLNVMSRMSGIATLTAEFVAAARRANPDVRVAATRKTAPGLRLLDKRAVECGGGDTHRLALHDMVMIKDNHIAAVGGLEAAIRRAREQASFAKKIEVEVGGKSDAIAAARARVDVIMLDNMTAEETRSTMGGLEAEGLREGLLVESSGGVTLENVEEIASTGVDVISVGRLTHSAGFLDLALRFVK